MTGRPNTQPPECTVDGCDRPANCRGWCTMHYSRWQRTGTTNTPAINRTPVKTCTIDGCEQTPVGRGWCNTHYHRWKKHGDPLHLEPRPTRAPCKIDSCDTPSKSFGYCNKHYKRWRKNGDPLIGAAKPKRETKPAKPLTDPPQHLSAYLQARRARLGRNNAA